MSYRGGRREKAEPFDHLVKLLVLGDSSVGKSSLLLRFAENKFDPNFVLTIGLENLRVRIFVMCDLEPIRVDFKTKVVECGGRRIKLQVWDTAGQERFRTITPDIRRWMQNVEEYADPSIVRVLVANKLDLQAERQVSRSKGEDLAREYSIPFIETSAKGNVNVEEAFMCAASRIRDIRFSPGPIGSHSERAATSSSSQQLPSQATVSREWREVFNKAALSEVKQWNV